MLNDLEKTITYHSDTCEKHNVRLVVFEGVAECPRCFVEKENEQLQTVIVERFKNANSLVLAQKSLVSDKTLLDASLVNYETFENTEEHANKKIVSECIRRLKVGQTFNVILQGKAGTGKSHLSYAMLNALNEAKEFDNQKSCLFISFDMMLRKVRETFTYKESPYNEFYFLNLIEKIDFLVIDDLGAETGAVQTDKAASDFVHKILYAISTSRQDKATIYTTNLNSESLNQLYDSKLISRCFKKPKFIIFKESKDKRIADKPF